MLVSMIDTHEYDSKTTKETTQEKFENILE